MFDLDQKVSLESFQLCLLTIKTPDRHQWRRSDVFIINFEHIQHLALVFLLVTLNS